MRAYETLASLAEGLGPEDGAVFADLDRILA